MLWLLATAALAVDPGAGCDPVEPVDAVLHGPRADGTFGRALAAGDFDGDGWSDLAVAAPDLDDGEVHVYRGSATGLTDSVDWTLVALDPVHDLYGWGLDAGDFDGDGLDDLAVVADEVVHVHFGSAAGPSGASRQDLAVPQVGTAGTAVTIGDADGDGFDDLVLGPQEGVMLEVWRGGPTGLTLAPQQPLVPPSAANFGELAAGPGDVDGDGLDDLVVASGNLYFYAGGGLDGGQPQEVVLPPDAGRLISVAGAGDTDGDGYRDVVLTADGDTNRVFLFRGGPGGLDAPEVVWGAPSRDFGEPVAGPGDVDGDGFDDVLLSAYDFDSGDPGSVHLYPGSASGPVGAPTRSWQATDPLCSPGVSVEGAGDVNGDGCPDFAFANPYVDWRSGDDAGRVWIVHGCDAGSSGDTGTPLDTGAPLDTATPADTAEPDSTAPPSDEDDETDGRGCGCSTGGSAAAWWVLLPLLALVGCSGSDKPTSDTDIDVADTDTDVDADTDVDTDVDTDTDAETGDTAIGDLDLATASRRYVGSDEEGSLGWTVSTAGDVDGDGLDDIVFSAGFAQRAWVLNGPVDAVSLQTADTTWTAQYAGYTLDGGGDLDGDGLSDIVLGTRLDVYDPTSDPVARVFVGEADGTLAGWAQPAVAIHHAAADTTGATQQYEVAWVGDLDGDGDHALAVSNTDAGPSPSAGVAWLLSDPPATAELDTHAVARFLGNSGFAYVGATLRTGGDGDGDGVADLLIGSVGTYDVSAVYLASGTSTGDVVLDGAVPRIVPTGVRVPTEALDGGTDASGDGSDDLLIGVQDEDSYTNPIRSAIVIDGPLTGERGADTALAVFEGQSVDDLSVETARFAGDVDGDGAQDVVVGAGGSSLSDPGGVVALYFGPVSGTRSLSDADRRWVGEMMGAEAGQAVDAADVDGDGLSDLLIGSPGWDAVDGEGAVYVVLGADIP